MPEKLPSPGQPQEQPEKLPESIPAQEKPKENLREKLEQFYGKPLNEIYQEETMEGLRGLQSELHQTERQIELSDSLARYLSEADMGMRELTWDQKQLFQELKMTPESLRSFSQSLAKEKEDKSADIAEYRKENERQLTEREFFTKHFGAYEEFLSQEGAKGKAPTAGEQAPEVITGKPTSKPEKFKNLEAEAQYLDYVRSNFETSRDEMDRLSLKAQELRGQLDNLWPTQIFKRNLIKDELKSLYGTIEEWRENRRYWESQLQHDFPPERVAKLEKLKWKKEEPKEVVKKFEERGKKEKVHELTEKVLMHSAEIRYIQQALEKLWPWQVNEKYRLLGELGRAQSALESYAKALDGLQTGKLKGYIDIRKSSEKE